MENAIIPFDALQNMAKAVSESKLWRSVDSPQKALALMMLCQSEGLHPMTAVRRYDLIQGTPTLKSEAQLAEFYARGGVVKWMQRTAEVCEAKFSHPKHCPDGVIIKWTLEDARRAGLLSKDNWKNFPRQMLSARVAAEGVQVVDPGAGLGMLTPEEAIDVQNNVADQAALLASTLTGEAREEIQTLPAVEMEDKEFRKLRAELNKTLQACITEADFQAACKAFQKAHTKAIWVKLTRHNETETYGLLAQEHQKRVQDNDFRCSPEGQEKWRDALANCDRDRFAFFQDAYKANDYLQTQENLEAIEARGRELGIEEYADTDNEMHKLSD